MMYLSYLLYLCKYFYRQYICLCLLYAIAFLFFFFFLSSTDDVFSSSKKFKQRYIDFDFFSSFFVQVLFVIDTHAYNACISRTLASLCKYFSLSIHMLLMHVFHVRLLFVQVFFIVNTHASNACISITLAFMCRCFSSSIDVHTCAFPTCIFCTLAFYASIFCRQLTCIHMLLMHVFFAHLLFMQVFFIVSRRVYTCFSCMYFFCSPSTLRAQIFVSECKAIIWTITSFGCLISQLSFELWISKDQSYLENIGDILFRRQKLN